MALVDHEGGAEFPYYQDDVFEALVKAIPTVSGMRLQSSDKISGRVVAKAGMSLASWGENIEIGVSEISPGRTRVSIISAPKTGLALGGAFDFGKNRKNIERILDAVSAILSQKTPIPPPPPPPPPNTAVVNSPAERLTTLQKLLDNGLITNAEFEKRRGEILSEI
jgi:hypothetical protein